MRWRPRSSATSSARSYVHDTERLAGSVLNATSISNELREPTQISLVLLEMAWPYVRNPRRRARITPDGRDGLLFGRPRRSCGQWHQCQDLTRIPARYTAPDR